MSYKILTSFLTLEICFLYLSAHRNGSSTQFMKVVTLCLCHGVSSHIQTLGNLVRIEKSAHISAVRIFSRNFEPSWTSILKCSYAMCTYLSSISCHIVFYISACFSPLLYCEFLLDREAMYFHTFACPNE